MQNRKQATIKRKIFVKIKKVFIFFTLICIFTYANCRLIKSNFNIIGISSYGTFYDTKKLMHLEENEIKKICIFYDDKIIVLEDMEQVKIVNMMNQLDVRIKEMEVLNPSVKIKFVLIDETIEIALGTNGDVLYNNKISYVATNNKDVDEIILFCKKNFETTDNIE